MKRAKVGPLNNPLIVALDVETFDEARVLVTIRTAMRVNVEIFNSLGDKAASLLDEVMDPGQRELVWDGRGSAGMPVASGVYVMAIHGEGFSETVKLVVLK